MAEKQLSIVDRTTGAVLEDVVFTGGYNIVYCNNHDNGTMKKINKLDNAKFGDKHWIKNMWYQPIAHKLTEKFPELKHIKAGKILFIEDMDWVKPDNNKPQYRAKVKKAPKEFSSMTGYDFILETRHFYIENMQQEQVIALIYHELLHIDTDGSLRPHDIEDWSQLIATFGADWAETVGSIRDILDDEFDESDWLKLPTAAQQLSMFSRMNPIRMIK